MTIPQVHSNALSNLLGTVGHKIEQFTATLDNVSDDIRAIERWLQASGIRVRVEHVYRTEEQSDETAVRAYLKALDYRPAEELQPVSARRHTYALAWAAQADERQWRILHSTYHAEGTLGVEHRWSEPQVVESRPLIETPAPVRLGIGNALEKLVEALASMVPDVYGQETLIEGDLSVSDTSIPESATGPWRAYFQTGPEMESITGSRLYREWNDVLAALRTILGDDVSLEGFVQGRSFCFHLQAPVRVLRELKLM
jgi:hypothetical protein